MKEATPATETVVDALDHGLPPGGPAMGSEPGLGVQSAYDGDKETVRVIEEETVLRLLEEELSIGRRKVETGRVRVHRATREVVQSVDEELFHDQHEIETIAIGTFVDERPLMRETDDEIIIPIVEEVLVVERRLRLKEELHIKKQRVSQRHREDVILRVQEAHVSRLPPNPSRENY